nr:transcription factor vrtr2 [Quercus suber]
MDVKATKVKSRLCATIISAKESIFLQGWCMFHVARLRFVDLQHISTRSYGGSLDGVPSPSNERSSLQCSPSHRKPRARHAGKKAIDSELRSRITKLESLVETLSSEVSTQELKPDELSGSPTDGTNPTASSAMAEYKYLANPFWLTLASEVQALRDALNDDEGDEDEDSSPGTQQSGASGAQSENEQFDLLICPPGSVFVLPGALQEPTPLMQTALYSIFFENVAPFQRYYHCPTLRAFLERGASYLGQSATMPNGRLTKAAIWYSAVNTLTEDECMLRFGASRADLSSQYKKYVEILLSQVDLMCTTEMVTLQAFLTYMVLELAPLRRTIVDQLTLSLDDITKG